VIEGPIVGPSVLGPKILDFHQDPVDFSGLLGDDLIDEPVTSGGDSSLWGDDDEEDDEDHPRRHGKDKNTPPGGTSQ
jgi:hypothetical protein